MKKSGTVTRIVTIAAATALLAAAAVTGSPRIARLHLKNGRRFVCTVLTLNQGEVTVQRELEGGTILTEYHACEAIAALEFPRPEFLDGRDSRNVLDQQELRMAVQAAEEEYARWKPFADIPGGWAVPVGFRYAELLERQQQYSAAYALYTECDRPDVCRETARKTILRRAVCQYYMGQYSNAYVFCTNAVANALTDTERAEAAYYLGRVLTELKQPVESLFMLLKNVVFYSYEGEWEAKSLMAVLSNYALLNDRERIVTTCNVLMRRYPDTAYALHATNCLRKIAAGQSLIEASSAASTAEKTNSSEKNEFTSNAKRKEAGQ